MRIDVLPLMRRRLALPLRLPFDDDQLALALLDRRLALGRKAAGGHLWTPAGFR